MSIIIYSGPGVDPFCQAQAVKTYSSLADDRSIQVQVRDKTNLWQALTQKGPAKKWLVLPGGGAIAMAIEFPSTAKQEIKDIWARRKMGQLNLIGHCAGAVLLSKQLYSRAHFETKYSIQDTHDLLLNVVPVSSFCPLFPSENEFDPRNVKAIRVAHTLHTDYRHPSETFNSFSLLGPGFLNESLASINVIREMTFSKGTPQTISPMFEGNTIPSGLMYHRDGNKACLSSDHIEFDPNDINETFFNNRWDKYKTALEKAKNKSEEEIEQIRIDCLSNFNSVQETLIEFNKSRKTALEDTLIGMDIPLKG